MQNKRFLVVLAIIIQLIGFFVFKYGWLIFTIYVLVFLSYPQSLKPLKNRKFWVTYIILLLLVPIFARDPQSQFLGVSYNAEVLSQMLMMSLRGLMLFALFQVMTFNLPRSTIETFIQRINLPYLAVILEMAQKASPAVKSIFIARKSIFSRAWAEEKSLHLIIEYFTDIMVDFIAFADDLTRDESAQSMMSPQSIFDAIDASSRRRIFLVSGHEAQGKTTWIKAFITEANNRKIAVDGFISEQKAFRQDRWAQELVRIKNGESHFLSTSDEIESALHIGKYYFDASCFDWAFDSRHSISDDCLYYILDEVGFLELEGNGFHSFIQFLISDQQDINLIISVRKKLLARVGAYLASLGLAAENIHIV